jgi:hypothetical protein
LRIRGRARDRAFARAVAGPAMETSMRRIAGYLLLSALLTVAAAVLLGNFEPADAGTTHGDGRR